MNVLVTGGTGFVGRHLVPALEAAGHDATVLVRRDVEVPGAATVRADLASPVSGLPAVDAVMHLAQANVPYPEGTSELDAVNVASTLTLLDHALQCGGRFVLASSGSVYGFGPRPFVETDALTPPDFYAATKVRAESFVESYSDRVATAVVRLFFPYGAGLERRLVADVGARVREGRPVELRHGGRPRINPVCVDDVVALLLRLLEEPGGRVVNAAGPERCDIRELALTWGEVLGREPVFEDVAGESRGDLLGDNALMLELLGGRPLVPLFEGLRRTVG